MSSILKALKKLEEEQTDRSADSPVRSGGQFVAPAPAGRHPLLLIGCGIGIGLLLAGGGYYLLPGRPDPPLAIKSPKQHSSEPELAAPAIATKPSARPDPSGTPKVPESPPAIATPVTPAARPITTNSSRTAPAAGAGAAARVVPGIAAVPASLLVAQRPVAAIRTKTAGSKPSPQSNQPVTASPVPVPAPVAQVQVERHDIPSPGRQWVAPHLVVSEILPASGGERMAIVNGLPVMEGTMVEDAVVKEVRAGQVIFEIDGKSVVVPLSPP